MTTSRSEPERTGIVLPPTTTSMSSSSVAAVEEDIDELSTGSGSKPPRYPSPPVKRSGTPLGSSLPTDQQQERSSVPQIVGNPTAAHAGGTGGSPVVAEGSRVLPGDFPVVPILEVPQAVPAAGTSVAEIASSTATPEREHRLAVPMPPEMPASFTAGLLARGETTSHGPADEPVSTIGGAGSSTRLSTGQDNNTAGSQPLSSSSTSHPTLSLRSALHTYTKLRIEDLAPGAVGLEDLDRQMTKLSGMLDGCDGLDRRRVSFGPFVCLQCSYPVWR